jgi:hypothetical protein
MAVGGGGRRLAPWWKGFAGRADGGKYPWEAHERDVPHKQNFDMVIYKVDGTGQFIPTVSNRTLFDQECSYANPVAKKYEAYGDQCVYNYRIDDSTDIEAGTTVVFQLKFTDKTDGTERTMFSAPAKFVATATVAPASSSSGPAEITNPGISDTTGTAATQNSATAVTPRKLHKEDGHLVDSPPDSKEETKIPMSSLPVQKGSSRDYGDYAKAPERKLTGFLDADEMDDSWSFRGSVRQLSVANADLNLGEVIPNQDITNGAQYGYQRVNSNISFQDRMQELHPICTRKPLHYEVGAGIFFRMKLHNFEIPGTADLGIFSTLSNLASFANMDTLDIPLAKTALGKKLEELLPKQFCSEGVCDGTLPGCPGQTVHPITIPKVEFKFDRTFNQNLTTGEAKEGAKAAAFAMALLPEFVRVASIVIGSFWKKTEHPPHFYNGNYYHTGNVVYYNGNRCRWQTVSTCVQTFEYRSTDYQGCTMVDHKDKLGWCSIDRKFKGNWRACNLLCRNDADGTTSLYAGKVVRGHITTHPSQTRRLFEDPDEDKPQTDRMLLEFVEPKEVPYRIDEDLIATLIKRKAFRGMAGDREIVAFRLHRNGSEPTDDETGMIHIKPEQKYEVGVEIGSYVTKLSAPTSKIPVTTIVGSVAIFAAVSLFAGVYRIKQRSAQVQPYTTVAEEEVSAQD